MADIRIVEQTDQITLQIEGELSINDALNLRDSLSQAIDYRKPILIDLDRVTEFDLTAFQLFCSAHRTAMAQGIRLRIQPQNSKQFLEIIEQIGYPRQLGCNESNPQDCLWIIG
ncbi:MAG: STAS domain-containing protein [Candidatus Delongbacteria bacterium]|nr:STAS domain-containing protein [Candidatus Delongbacteria bacterium]